ncbi:MAG: DJ-1/PfpI family protein [Verrucomicrobia bacterium]|nr:DJ-1/PfpI family protein [Verrucomicrobiota bacterium]MBV8275014.1 DJ-1/PfpI family protein [Verrucomicrobiota bacterium]
MNRRELIQKTALLGVGLICGYKKAVAETSVTNSSSSVPSPLNAPAAGNLSVAFVLGKDAEVLDFAGPLEVFAGAVTKDGRPLFAPYMVAENKDPVTVGGGMKVLPDYDFKSAPQPKLIVIPAMNFSVGDTEMFDWIRGASKATDLTMSVCNGAFVLAKTGLLDGKSATCHHGGFFGFAARYPDVHLRRGARFVEDGNLASAGGISSGIDLALRVVERYVGHDLAVQVADGMEYQGKGWLDPNSNEVYAKMPELTGAHPLCPVCLQDADRSISTDYKGKTVCFCSKGHKDVFEKHTDVYDRFLAEDTAIGSQAGQ